MICTLTVRGPRGRVAADERHAVGVRKIGKSRAQNRSSQAGSTLGSVRASVAHAGVAPMAAKSLKFTASARWPIERGIAAFGKMAAGHDGIHRGHQFRVRAATRSTAASSPTPSTTPDRAAPDGARKSGGSVRIRRAARPLSHGALIHGLPVLVRAQFLSRLGPTPH